MGLSYELHDGQNMIRNVRIERIECEVSGTFDVEALRVAVAAELSRHAMRAPVTGEAFPRSSIGATSDAIVAEVAARSASRHL